MGLLSVTLMPHTVYSTVTALICRLGNMVNIQAYCKLTKLTLDYSILWERVLKKETNICSTNNSPAKNSIHLLSIDSCAALLYFKPYPFSSQELKIATASSTTLQS